MSTPSPPRLLPLGDGAVTLQFGDTVDAATHARVLGFVHALEQALAAPAGPGALGGVREWLPSFAAVTVIADDAHEAAAAARDAALLALARQAAPRPVAGRHWRLPVCFDAEFAPDLPALAAARGLAEAQVQALFTATRFRVYLLGFLPGFAYLGDLPEALAWPRRATPRREVPERSVAVAGRMAAVYPWASPGGWHLIGRTPVRLFEADAPEPALLRAGDTLSWLAIDRDRYEALAQRAAAGALDRRDWCTDAQAPGP